MSEKLHFEDAREGRKRCRHSGWESSDNATPLKIWKASVRTGLAGVPGTVLAVDKDSIVVACGNDALALEILQRPNAKAMPASQFVQGFAVSAGDRCAAAA